MSDRPVDQRTVAERVEGLRPWTIPNAITLLRLLLLVPVCWFIWTGEQGSWMPVVLLGVWASTDWVDGVLARALNQTSKLGTWLDPFADRLGIWGLALTLALSGAIGWWVLIMIFVVDMFVAVLAARVARAGELSVTWVGKIRTAVLFVAVVLVVMGVTVWRPADAVGQVLLIVGVVLHIVAAADYIAKGRRYARTYPRS